jgi:S-adenosylmethionine synthetase
LPKTIRKNVNMHDVMYTSESVTDGHPDKLCDQISDAIVDHFIARDPQARVRAECAVSRAIVFIAARFASEVNIDFTRLARKVIGRIGYDHPDFNPQSCSILTSPQVLPLSDANRFDEMEMSDDHLDTITADNQVTVFGFACNHTATLMPLPISLAHGMARRLSMARRDRKFAYLMPDAKVQVGVEFKNRIPSRVHSVAMDVHLPDTKLPKYSRVLEDITREVVKPAIQNEKIKFDPKMPVLINATGAYAGGPMNHCGLTGRKNAVDTYGEYARHSGKALSGKDPLRIDRIGAYAARYAAKNVVASGLADECEVVLSYATGQPRPVTLLAQTNGTGRVDDDRLTKLLHSRFDFRVASILKQFRLRRLSADNPTGFYQHLAVYGHFGREDLDLPWEKTDKAQELRSQIS